MKVVETSKNRDMLNVRCRSKRTIRRCTGKVVETFRDSSQKRNRLRGESAVEV
jgi:hypothetical protein